MNREALEGSFWLKAREEEGCWGGGSEGGGYCISIV